MNRIDVHVKVRHGQTEFHQNRAPGTGDMQGDPFSVMKENHEIGCFSGGKLGEVLYVACVHNHQMSTRGAITMKKNRADARLNQHTLVRKTVFDLLAEFAHGLTQ